MGQIKYSTEGIHVGPFYGPTGVNYDSGDIRELTRVQSSNFEIQIQTNPTQRLGGFYEEDAVVESPYVLLNGTYYAVDGFNESALGFIVDKKHSAVAKLLTGQKDYFVTMRDYDFPEHKVLGIGNAMLTSYSIRGSVGEPISADFSIRGFNANLSVGTVGNPTPRINVNGSGLNNIYNIGPYKTRYDQKSLSGIQDVAAVGQGQIEILFQDTKAFGLELNNNNKIHTQSFELSFNSPQNEINRLGEKYPFYRQTNLPIRVNLNASFRIEDRDEIDLESVLCKTSDLLVNIYSPCNYTNDEWEKKRTLKMQFDLKGLKYKGQSETLSIQNFKEINVSWEAQIYDPNALDDKFRISGNFGRIIYLPYNFYVISGQQISGIPNFNEEIVFKKYLYDVEEPDFDLEFTGKYDVVPSYHKFVPIKYFAGDEELAFNIEGQLNENITQKDFNYPSKYLKIFSGFKIERQFGYSGLKDGAFRFFDNFTSIPYVFRNISPKEQTLNFKQSSLNSKILTSGQESFISNPEIPIYFHQIFAQGSYFSEIGDNFAIEAIAVGNTSTKKYLIEGTIVGDRQVKIDKNISDNFLIWLDSATPQESFKTNNSGTGSFLQKTELDSSGTPVLWFEDKGDFIKSHFAADTSDSTEGFLAVPSGQLDNTVLRVVSGEKEMNHYIANTGDIGIKFGAFEWFFAFKFNSVNVSSPNESIQYHPKIVQFAQNESGKYGLGLSVSGDSSVFFIETGESSSLNFFELCMTGVCDNKWHTISIRGKSQDTIYAKVDNNIEYSKFFNGSINTSGYSSTGTYILDGTSYYKNEFSGDFGEMICCPFFLNTFQRNEIQEYLDFKWRREQ